MISLKSRVITPIVDNNKQFTSDYLTSSSSSPFSNRLYFTGVGQRPSTNVSNFYSKGRLLGTSSVERLNRSASPPATFRGGGSSWDLRSSSPVRRPRNSSVDRLRRRDPHPSYRSISRDELSKLDLATGTSNAGTISTHHPTSSIMERRNMIISNFNRNLPPSGLSSSPYIGHHSHHNLHPRSNFAASRNSALTTATSSSASSTRPWPSSNLEFFRPTIRDRPSLASIKSTLKGRVKATDSTPSRYIKPLPSTSAASEASLKLSRYRHVIKFREFHIDEPLTKRKASISWDLPLETISSSSSYNSKSSGNSIGSPYPPRSKQSSPEKDSRVTVTSIDKENVHTGRKDVPQPSPSSTSNSSLSLICRRNSVSRSDAQSPKLKVPKLEITSDPVIPDHPLPPDVIELPKPVSPLRVQFEVSVSSLEFVPNPDQNNQENNSFEVNVVLPLKSKSKPNNISSDLPMPKSQLADSNKSNAANQQKIKQLNSKSPGSIPKITRPPQPPHPPSSSSSRVIPSSPPLPSSPATSLSKSILPKNEIDKLMPPTISSQPPLKLPKGRSKPTGDKDRPTSRPINKQHHRKPTSPDLTRTTTPSPVESPISSRPPSPSPSLFRSSETENRRMSKSGSKSPNSMTTAAANNKHLSPSSPTNEVGPNKANKSSTSRPNKSKQHSHHHRKSSSSDATRSNNTPSPVDSPLSSRPPSPSPSFLGDEKGRRMSKSGSKSPNLMVTRSNSNKMLTQTSSPTVKTETISKSSSTSKRTVVSPRQEYKPSVDNSSASTGIKFSVNMSSNNSSLPSPTKSLSLSSSSSPGTTITPEMRKEDKSSSSSSSHLTEAKCKGLILKTSKETEGTKKRSLTPNQPNNRPPSPILPSTSASSPSSPPPQSLPAIVNQVNSFGSESSKADTLRKISPSPAQTSTSSSSPISENSTSMPKPPLTEKVKVNLKLMPKPSTISTNINSSNIKVPNKHNTSTSCPPTPTDSLPSYVVKVKTSSVASKSNENQSQSMLSKKGAKGSAKGSTDNLAKESSSTPSSPKISSSSSSPLMYKLNKKSSGSDQRINQQPPGPPIRPAKSSQLPDTVKVQTKVDPEPVKITAKSTNQDDMKKKKSTTGQQLNSIEITNEDGSSASSRFEDKMIHRGSSSVLSTSSNDRKDMRLSERSTGIDAEKWTNREESKKLSPEVAYKESKVVPKDEPDRVAVDVKGKTEREGKYRSDRDSVKPDERETDKQQSSETIVQESKPDKNQINQQQNDVSRMPNSLDKLLVNGGASEEPSIVDNDKKEKKRIRFRTYTMADFELRKVLGRGSFGKVYLAQLKGHEVFFAIKFLKKHVVIEDDDLESIMVERKVLALGVKHPFICKLFCTFQTRGMVCFVMEFLAGGDLMFHVQSCGRFPEDRSRFYAAEIVSALNFLHSRFIIYRDLKLDNILLDSEGHVRLVDFGMCQCHIWKEECLPSNFCGTPEYMAPEIIKGVQYNQAVDWWSFGVLLYEMIVGDSPFKATDEDELLWNVCYEKVRIPYYVSKNAQSIILNLLERDPAERLGMPTSSKGDIRSQTFFESINWDAINSGKVKPPFVPNLKHSHDTCYFDREFTEMRAVLTPIDDYTVENVDHELFFGFDYTNPNMTD